MPNMSIEDYWKRRDICSCLGEVTTCRQWCKPCKGPSGITFREAHLACQHQCRRHLLAMCPRSEGPKLAADTQLLAGKTHSTENQLVGRYTSTKFAPYFFHLPFAWNNDITNLSLVWSMLFL